MGNAGTDTVYGGRGDRFDRRWRRCRPDLWRVRHKYALRAAVPTRLGGMGNDTIYGWRKTGGDFAGDMEDLTPDEGIIFVGETL